MPEKTWTFSMMTMVARSRDLMFSRPFRNISSAVAIMPETNETMNIPLEKSCLKHVWVVFSSVLSVVIITTGRHGRRTTGTLGPMNMLSIMLTTRFSIVVTHLSSPVQDNLLEGVVLSATESLPPIRGHTFVRVNELHRSCRADPSIVEVSALWLFTVRTAHGSAMVAMLMRTPDFVPCIDARMLSWPLPTVTFLVFVRYSSCISSCRLVLAIM